MFPPQVDDIFGIDLPNNDGDPRDDNQHGTHVAGILGAIGNNNIGIAGAASYTQNIKIMAIKFLDNEGGGDTHTAKSNLRAPGQKAVAVCPSPRVRIPISVALRPVMRENPSLVRRRRKNFGPKTRFS